MDETGEGKIVVVPLMMTPDVFEILNKAALQKGWTVSKIVTEAIKRECEGLSGAQKEGRK